MLEVLDPTGQDLEAILRDGVLFGDEQCLPANARVVDGSAVGQALVTMSLSIAGNFDGLKPTA